MRRIVLIALPLLILACSREPAVNPDSNHTHVDFAVWINGEQLDFSAQKYMSNPYNADEPTASTFFVEQASAHEYEEEGDAIPERKYLHLHDGNGHVIHRHKPGLTLGDFFTSIGFAMTKDCFALDTGESYCSGADKRWRMFVNGEEWPFTPTYDFQDMDQILLTYGSADDEIARELDTMTNDACLYSRTCPERGDPPTENCIADPAVPCVAP